MADDFKRWRIGGITITRIVELGPMEVGPHELFPDATRDDVKAEPWLAPNFVNEKANLVIDFQCFLIEAAGKKILVDTCIGDGKTLEEEALSNMTTGFLETLTRAGAGPDDVDVVLCTHLHFDHVGWNTRKVDGAWVPTYPKARYLFNRPELDFTLAAEHTPGDEFVAESIQPILDAGLVDLVATDHQVCAGVRLIPTPGHTPGHVSVWVEDAGESAVITGDMIHHPLQLARPEFASSFCADPEQSRASRRSLFGRLAGQPTLLIGSHFCEPTAGRVLAHGQGWRLECVEVAVPAE